MCCDVSVLFIFCLCILFIFFFFFFSSRRRHTRSLCDWSSDVCSSDLARRVARAQSGWLPACGYIYLWRDSHGSRWMSIRLLALIPVAAAISLALSAAVDAVALPLFLDTTGTILATALAGPGVGIATGVVTSAVNTLRNPTFWRSEEHTSELQSHSDLVCRLLL